MKLIKWIALFSLIASLYFACSSSEKLLAKCFPPFEVKHSELFSGEQLLLWSFSGGNAYEDFLIDHLIVGYLGFTLNNSGTIPLDDMLHFTGRAFKMKPDLAHRVLGGSKTSMLYEVSIYDQHYVLNESTFKDSIQGDLKSICHLDSQ